MADRSYKKVLTFHSIISTNDTVTIAELTTISELNICKNLYNFGNVKATVIGNIITIDEPGLTDVNVTIIAAG